MAAPVSMFSFVDALAERRAWLETSVRQWKRSGREGAPKASDGREATPHSAEELLDSALEELRVAEEELQVQNDALDARGASATEQWFESLFNRAPEPYLVTDESARIRSANRAAGELLGFPWDALAGKPLSVFIPMQARGSFREAVRKCRVVAVAARNWPQLVQPRGAEPCSVSATVSCSETVHGRWLLWMLRREELSVDPDFL
jgi:PAS domain S-box-containing protein